MTGLPWRVAVGVLGVLLLNAAALQAQTVSAPPPSLPPAPSVVGREVLESDPAANRRPKPDIAVPGGAGLAVPPELANKEVLLSDIQVEGMTAFNAGALQPLFAPVLNRRVPFSEVVAAVNRVTALYEQGGYVFYSVILPKQDLDSGKLRIIVVEGSISAVDFGDGIKSEKLRAHIRELIAPLIGRKPLRRADLERRLLLSADLPGVAIQASAKPDAAGGDKVVLVVNGTFERFSPIAQIDSFQTIPDVSVNFRVGGVGRSLLFGGDALELRYLSALPWNRLQMFDARYGVPIGDNGGRLSLLGQAVWQRPLTLINGQAVDFLGRSFLGRVQYSHPFVRSLKWTMMGLAMLDVIDVDYTFLGIGIPGDSLRVARTGLFGAYTDPLGGFWSGTVLGSVGLGLAGAEANGRFGASPSFAKLNLSIERVQPFWTHFSALIRASGQMTTGTVPASEVFAYGGRDYGRAFTVAESVGDRGAAVLAELRYNPDWIPIPKKYLDPQFYAFADHGWLSSVNPLNPPLFNQGTSVGAGIRARIWEQWSGEIELAKVVSTPNVGDRPMRASVRFGSRF